MPFLNDSSARMTVPKCHNLRGLEREATAHLHALLEVDWHIYHSFNIFRLDKLQAWQQQRELPLNLAIYSVLLKMQGLNTIQAKNRKDIKDWPKNNTLEIGWSDLANIKNP